MEFKKSFKLPNSPSVSCSPPTYIFQSQRNHKKQTAVVESGASGFYFSKNARIINFDPTAPTITVRNANGQPHQSSGADELGIPNLSSQFTLSGTVMPLFQNKGLGPICDADCKVTFTNKKSNNI